MYRRLRELLGQGGMPTFASIGSFVLASAQLNTRIEVDIYTVQAHLANQTTRDRAVRLEKGVIFPRFKYNPFVPGARGKRRHIRALEALLRAKKEQNDHINI